MNIFKNPILLIVLVGFVFLFLMGFALPIKLPAEHVPQSSIVIEDASISDGGTAIQKIVLYHKGGDPINLSDITIMIAVNGEKLVNSLDTLPAAGDVVGFNGAFGGVFRNTSSNNQVWEFRERGLFNIATGAAGRDLKNGDKVTVVIMFKHTDIVIARPSAVVHDMR